MVTPSASIPREKKLALVKSFVDQAAAEFKQAQGILEAAQHALVSAYSKMEGYAQAYHMELLDEGRDSEAAEVFDLLAEANVAVGKVTDDEERAAGESTDDPGDAQG